MSGILEPYIPDSWTPFEHPPKIEESATFGLDIRDISTVEIDELTGGRKKFVVEDTYGRRWGLSKEQLNRIRIAFKQYKKNLNRSQEYEGLQTQVYTQEEFLSDQRRESRSDG